jgi:hypothetical protein
MLVIPRVGARNPCLDERSQLFERGPDRERLQSVKQFSAGPRRCIHGPALIETYNSEASGPLSLSLG